MENFKKIATKGLIYFVLSYALIIIAFSIIALIPGIESYISNFIEIFSDNFSSINSLYLIVSVVVELLLYTPLVLLLMPLVVGYFNCINKIIHNEEVKLTDIFETYHDIGKIIVVSIPLIIIIYILAGTFLYLMLESSFFVIFVIAGAFLKPDLIDINTFNWIIPTIILIISYILLLSYMFVFVEYVNNKDLSVKELYEKTKKQMNRKRFKSFIIMLVFAFISNKCMLLIGSNNSVVYSIVTAIIAYILISILLSIYYKDRIIDNSKDVNSIDNTTIVNETEDDKNNNEQ